MSHVRADEVMNQFEHRLEVIPVLGACQPLGELRVVVMTPVLPPRVVHIRPVLRSVRARPRNQPSGLGSGSGPGNRRAAAGEWFPPRPIRRARSPRAATPRRPPALRPR